MPDMNQIMQILYGLGGGSTPRPGQPIPPTGSPYTNAPAPWPMPGMDGGVSSGPGGAGMPIPPMGGPQPGVNMPLLPGNGIPLPPSMPNDVPATGVQNLLSGLYNPMAPGGVPPIGGGGPSTGMPIGAPIGPIGGPGFSGGFAGGAPGPLPLPGNVTSGSFAGGPGLGNSVDNPITSSTGGGGGFAGGGAAPGARTNQPAKLGSAGRTVTGRDQIPSKATGSYAGRAVTGSDQIPGKPIGKPLGSGVTSPVGRGGDIKPPRASRPSTGGFTNKLPRATGGGY